MRKNVPVIVKKKSDSLSRHVLMNCTRVCLFGFFLTQWSAWCRAPARNRVVGLHHLIALMPRSSAAPGHREASVDPACAAYRPLNGRRRCLQVR